MSGSIMLSFTWNVLNDLYNSDYDHTTLTLNEAALINFVTYQIYICVPQWLVCPDVIESYTSYLIHLVGPTMLGRSLSRGQTKMPPVRLSVMDRFLTSLGLEERI